MRIDNIIYTPIYINFLFILYEYVQSEYSFLFLRLFYFWEKKKAICND